VALTRVVQLASAKPHQSVLWPIRLPSRRTTVLTAPKAAASGDNLEKLGLGADALPELLTAAERMGFSGLNITHPCKGEHRLLAGMGDVEAGKAHPLGGGQKLGQRVGTQTSWPA
jgi:hypothetical protein